LEQKLLNLFKSLTEACFSIDAQNPKFEDSGQFEYLSAPIAADVTARLSIEAVVHARLQQVYGSSQSPLPFVVVRDGAAMIRQRWNRTFGSVVVVILDGCVKSSSNFVQACLIVVGVVGLLRKASLSRRQRQPFRRGNDIDLDTSARKS
jgi:hypothetical protein